MKARVNIFWASPNTLLDTANGAAMMVKECLKQLQRRGCKIRILSATVFVDSLGMALVRDEWPKIAEQTGRFVVIRRDGLEHQLLVTQRTHRRLMLSYEEQRWLDAYCRLLDEDRPDIVFFFDKSLITLLTASEAKDRGIPVGVFLMHGKNKGTRWCRDLSLMLTDTKATGAMYKKREGYRMTPIGTFIDPTTVRAETQTRQNLLFVNPIPQKGFVFVAQLALMMEKTRPDIRFEVIDTRGTWASLLEQVTKQTGVSRKRLANVSVTANTADMRPVYSRARLLLVPSLWWESGPRVIVEALLNGIPVIGSPSGGIPEVIGDGGFILSFPDAYFQPPYQRLFTTAELQQAADLITRLYDDPGFYDAAVANAYAAHAEHHQIDKNADYLLSVIQRCVSDPLRIGAHELCHRDS
ncbi:MAG: glycosyltransferase [Chromatiaceae bacterium]|nr:glycosyltransferase [Chromatiaceae bacterium]